MAKAKKKAKKKPADVEPPFSKWEKWPIWLVWSLDVDNTLSLREVSTSNSRARLALKSTKMQRRIIRAWIEPREANHLFGHRDVNWGVGDNITEEIMRRDKQRAEKRAKGDDDGERQEEKESEQEAEADQVL